MIRPVDFEPSQLFGDHPTKWMPADHWIIQRFGNYQPDGHTGEDYPCPSGTPVRAVTYGTVLHVGYLAGSYADNPWWIAPAFAGYCYVVDHGAFIGIYGHCMDGGARVRKGQRVSEGQVLGPSGNTGASTGDHLHFEVLPDGYVLNSYMYGRFNPAGLFGSASIAPQGTITPQEDTLSAAEVHEIKVWTQGQANGVLDQVWKIGEAQNAMLKDIARALGDVKETTINVGGVELTAQKLADEIAAAQLKNKEAYAKATADLLAARIGS